MVASNPYESTCSKCGQDYDNRKAHICRSKDKRRKAEAWLKAEPKIQPCRFCGRCMLAGTCCQRAQDYWTGYNDGMENARALHPPTGD